MERGRNAVFVALLRSFRKPSLAICLPKCENIVSRKAYEELMMDMLQKSIASLDSTNENKVIIQKDESEGQEKRWLIRLKKKQNTK